MERKGGKKNYGNKKREKGGKDREARKIMTETERGRRTDRQRAEKREAEREKKHV
jgi:hypothetical protein